MIKKERGIALVSLIITIVLMTIVASTVVYMSLDRFEINHLRKMMVDIELLEDKISNYYLKYNVLPVLRDASNNPIKYNQTLNFETNNFDNETYYIIDVKAMEGISLNYGEEGYVNPNASDDVYIINEETHTIYYVRGIKLQDKTHHYITINGTLENNDIPPANPEIKVISGTETEINTYMGEVLLEFVPGANNVSEVARTSYIVTKDGATLVGETTISSENNTYEINNTGTYTIELITYNVNGEQSKTEKTLNVTQIAIGDYVKYGITYKDMYTGYNFSANDGWRYIGKDSSGNYLILSTGIPVILNYNSSTNIGFDVNGWWGTQEEIEATFPTTKTYTIETTPNVYAEYGLRNNFAKISFYYQADGITTSDANTGIYRQVGKYKGTNKLGEAAFLWASLDSDLIVNVQALNYDEIYSITGTNDIATTDGDTGLFNLKNLEIESDRFLYNSGTTAPYWIGRAAANIHLNYCDNSNANRYTSSGSRGIRPVVVISSKANLVYNKTNSTWEIK